MFQAIVSPIFRSTLHIQLFGTMCWLCCRPVSPVSSRVGTLFQTAVYTKCSWRWAKLSPETCTASLKGTIKQTLLHLVGCWYHWNRFFIGCNHNTGTAVAQWLRFCAANRKVAGSIPADVSGFFIDIKNFRSHYGPGVDSASNRNEYLGVKAAGA